LAFRNGIFLRAFMYDFIEGFAPHLNHQMVEAALNKPNKLALAALFSEIELPIK